MAEEFRGRGACGGSLRNSFGNLLGSSPCSLPTNDIGSFGQPNPRRSSDDWSAGCACVGGCSTEVYKPQPQTTADGSVSVYSTLQTTGITISSSSTAPHDCNRDLPHDEGRSDENYSDILQEAADLDSGMDYLQQTKVHFPRIREDWNSRNISQDSLLTSLKRDVQNLPLEHHQPLNCHASSFERGETCQGLSVGFPLNSASYNYTSSLLQTLFDTNFDQPKQSILHKQAINYLYPENSNEFLPSLPKDTPMVIPSFTKQQPTNHLPSFINSTPLLNTTDADLSNVSGSFLSQLLPSSLNIKKPNLPRLSTKHQNETARGLSSLAKKFGNESSVKRPRIETSPLPTFRVRKEKLGDRITALQQLVSPFGKTDTASVLHEAIEYIKFLHDQVLSTPYLKTGFSPLLQRPQAADKSKDEEGLIHDLKSRGLCLIPIPSTFSVAADPTSDFWTPTFGGSDE